MQSTSYCVGIVSTLIWFSPGICLLCDLSLHFPNWKCVWLYYLYMHAVNLPLYLPFLKHINNEVCLVLILKLVTIYISIFPDSAVWSVNIYLSNELLKQHQLILFIECDQALVFKMKWPPKKSQVVTEGGTTGAVIFSLFSQGTRRVEIMNLMPPATCAYGK